MKLVRGRLAAISVRAALNAGAWAGLALGLVLGGLLGALLSWFAGAVLDWQRELGLTLGVTRNLLPFGSQVPALRWISGNWHLVVPLAALIVAFVLGLVGGFIGGLLAAAYNLSPRHAGVVVELAEEVPIAAAERPAEAEADVSPTRYDPLHP